MEHRESCDVMARVEPWTDGGRGARGDGRGVLPRWRRPTRRRHEVVILTGLGLPDSTTTPPSSAMAARLRASDAVDERYLGNYDGYCNMYDQQYCAVYAIYRTCIASY